MTMTMMKRGLRFVSHFSLDRGCVVTLVGFVHPEDLLYSNTTSNSFDRAIRQFVARV